MNNICAEPHRLCRDTLLDVPTHCDRICKYALHSPVNSIGRRGKCSSSRPLPPSWTALAPGFCRPLRPHTVERARPAVRCCKPHFNSQVGWRHDPA
ncbi:hypothetical protein EJ06DRAFT_42517 [Trichodelitschia bisporula]|uniref:Uncharacterized protein n=1 Tax=Trichodelitschia bisporula TaxID=703511 RepID=A0A6G1HW93_9PEZI|nr:hypothetical protein EJ06DRAFT_42517 [Trichodelitschia bisporula]